jgi:FecR protein
MSGRSLRQAPVEPLSNQAWRRVETAVFARLDDGVVLSMPLSSVPQYSYAAPRSRRPLRWHWVLSMGLSVTAAAAAAASVIHVSRSGHASLPEAAPIAALAVAEAPAAAPAPGVAQTVIAAELPSAPPMPSAQAPLAVLEPVLSSPSVVAPAPAASAATSSHDGLHVATARETRSIAVGDSRFTLSQHAEMLARGDDADGWHVELLRGRVEFDVAPRRNRPPFVIQSGDVNVRVLGTRFSVRRQNASTEVRVQRGVVEVEQQGHVARLRPGDLWLDGVVAGAVHDARPRATTPAARGKSTRYERPAPRSDRESRFDRAAGLESENAAEALDLYLALARGEDAWAANALYAAARLELDQGDRATGARLLGDYRERFPDGENIVEVEALRVRLAALPGQ